MFWTNLIKRIKIERSIILVLLFKIYIPGVVDERISFVNLFQILMILDSL